MSSDAVRTFRETSGVCFTAASNAVAAPKRRQGGMTMGDLSGALMVLR